MSTTTNTSVDDILGDIWDTRDLIDLIASLESDLSDIACDECGGEMDGERCPSAQDDRADDDAGHKSGDTERDDIAAELERAKALAAEVEDYSEDYQYGATVIDRDYFVTYAQELAEDIGAVPSDAGWPCSYIGWPAAADALAIDYEIVTFEGREFYVR